MMRCLLPPTFLHLWGVCVFAEPPWAPRNPWPPALSQGTPRPQTDRQTDRHTQTHTHRHSVVGPLMRAAQGPWYTGDSGEYSREGFSGEVSFRGGAGKVLSCPGGKTPPTLSPHPYSSPLPGRRVEASGTAPDLCFYDMDDTFKNIKRGGSGRAVIEPGSGVRETWL